MAITTTQEKYLHELGDIYDAEHRFLKGQQEALQQATDTQLQSGIQEHIDQTQQQIQNLEQVFSLLGQPARAEACDAAKGLVSEAQKNMQEAGTDPLRDCLIGAALAKVEHYEIASYRGLITGAQLMGQQQIVTLLQQNLQQEEQTAQKLEQSAPQLLQQAMQSEGTAAKGTVGAGIQQGAMAGVTGDQDVVVDNSQAPDILVDDTQMSGRAGS